jgi:hypothetical protein
MHLAPAHHTLSTVSSAVNGAVGEKKSKYHHAFAERHNVCGLTFCISRGGSRRARRRRLHADVRRLSGMSQFVGAINIEITKRLFSSTI